MIIVPEREAVVILVPRTGSGSLKQALLARYPGALPLYRHMEADGVPAGYDRWRRLGVVRQPVERLWSLYKFLQRFDESGRYQADYRAAMRASVQRPFEDWLLHNETVFTNPFERSWGGRYFPHYTVRHSLPENRKSQFLYLRPDLGTEIFGFGSAIFLELDVAAGGTENRTAPEPPPVLSRAAQDYVERVFAWDLGAWRC